MIEMGFDLSTSCSGYAVFDKCDLIKYGAITPKSKDWRDRVMEETLEIARLLKQHAPDAIYVEDVPKKPGANTLHKLGAVQGMILSLCAGFKIRPTFLLPSDCRRSLGLYDGTKDGLKREVLKEKAVYMANDVFGLNLEWHGANSKKSEDDIAEAILIAYSQIRTR